MTGLDRCTCCGCTDDAPCPSQAVEGLDSCFWAAPLFCSACAFVPGRHCYVCGRAFEDQEEAGAFRLPADAIPRSLRAAFDGGALPNFVYFCLGGECSRAAHEWGESHLLSAFPFYRPPAGEPSSWRQERSGKLRLHLLDLLAGRKLAFRASMGVRNYFLHHADAPCWDGLSRLQDWMGGGPAPPLEGFRTPGAPLGKHSAALEGLRSSVRRCRDADALRGWLIRALEEGIDPLGLQQGGIEHAC